jgi:hypothetical protein
VKVRVSGASDGDFDPERWWEKRVSVKNLTQEMVSMLVAIWEQHTDTGEVHKSQLIVPLRSPNALSVV